MLNLTDPEVIQLGIGALTGTGVSITLDRNGMSLFNAETRWQTLGLIGTFLLSFLLLSDLLIN